MTDQVYQNVQYPLKKVIKMLANLDDINSVPREYLDDDNREEFKKEIADFLNFWESEGKKNLEDLIYRLQQKEQ